MDTKRYPSKTTEGVTYTATVHDDGTATCNCPGFLMRADQSCWHTKDLLGIVEARNFVLTPPTPKVIPFKGKVPVATSKSMEKRLAAQTGLKEPWLSEPTPLKPMLASALPEGKRVSDYSPNDYVLEVKYDGHRLILTVYEDGSYVAWSRAGNRRTLPAHLVRALVHLAPGTYDGELYIPGMTSTDVTAKHLQHLLRYAIFDILRVGPHSAMDRPGTERRALLEMATSKRDPEAWIEVAEQREPTEECLQAIWASGMEGAVIKHKSTIYVEDKRTPQWIKFKKLSAGHAIITGFLSGELGPYSRVVAVDKDGTEVKVKSLNDEWRRDFAKGPNSYIGRTLVFSYAEKTRDGKYKSAMADHIL